MADNNENSNNDQSNQSNNNQNDNSQSNSNDNQEQGFGRVNEEDLNIIEKGEKDNINKK
ncbi:MAG: hypothetical protein HN704_12020 [Bacteroidetes bacterium]|jgi:hypothetical protein|nr:hypothetical protein [Bacteroidota bacterium]MBT6687250.1 hypothetical protein [Bacteroidota bacterium]MBT7144715.1 hypothetical protein [Bacteroidota bacterium]MBT7492318.1 hypothetical protein [Bacteroidota bacterium]